MLSLLTARIKLNYILKNVEANMVINNWPFRCIGRKLPLYALQ